MLRSSGAAAAILTAAVLATAPGALAQPHGLTLDDMLQAGSFGTEDFPMDPAGRRFAFPYLRRYLDQNGFGRYDAFGFQSTGEVWICDVRQPSKPLPLFSAAHPEESLLGATSGIDAAAFEGMWLGSFSPRGSRLLVYWKEGDRLRAGVYQFSNKHLTVFPFTPDLQFDDPKFRHATWVWLSEDEAAAGTLPPERIPVAKDWRRGAAHRLMADWQAAWKGEKPVVSVLESRADGVDGTMQPGALLRVDVRSGKVRELARGRFTDLRLSPGGNVLAALQVGAARGAQPGELTMSAGNMFRNEAVLIDLKQEGVLLAPAPGYEAANNTLNWSEDGKRLSFFAWRNGEPPARGMFQVFDVPSRRTRSFPHVGLSLALREPSWLGIPVAARFVGKDLAVAARAQPDANGVPRLDDLTDEKVSPDWFLLSARGVVRQLPAQSWQKKREPRFGAKTEAGNLAGVSADGRFAVYRGSGYREWTLSLKTADGRTEPVMSINAHFAEVRQPETRTLRYRNPVAGDDASADTRMLAAAFTLPPDWTPGRRCPVVVNVYPGGYYASDKDLPPRGELNLGLINPDAPSDYFGALGYIVLYPSAPIPLQRSPDGNPLGNWGKLAAAAANALVEQGYADADRIALYGVSQGSWSALSVIAQNHQFKSAIAGFGMADFISAYGTWGALGHWTDDFSIVNSGRVQRFETSRVLSPLIGATPWADPMAYVRASPVFAAARIDTPVMLIAADFDVFPMEQFDEMYTALARERKEVRYLRYRGEGHFLNNPASIRDRWSRMFAWIDQWSDVARDHSGRILYDGDRPASRRGAAAMSPGDFLKLEWFFGRGACPKTTPPGSIRLHR